MCVCVYVCVWVSVCVCMCVYVHRAETETRCDIAVNSGPYLDSLVLMRNWLETPGWSTSCIALAKMAARISRSVNTAWNADHKHKHIRCIAPVNLKILGFG